MRNRYNHRKFHTIQPALIEAPHPVGEKGARRKTHSTLKLFELPELFLMWSDHVRRAVMAERDDYRAAA
jgi:hypothetical protein